MKTALCHTVAHLLTLCILLSSVGVALSGELCVLTGIKQVNTVVQKDHCCEAPDQQTATEDDCCMEDVSYEKLEPVSSLKHFHLEQPVYFTEGLKSFLGQNAFSLSKADKLYTYTDSSPPLYGRSLLQKIQILLI